MLVACWGQGCREPSLGGCTDHRWAFVPHAPVSLPLTCLDVSVPPRQPLLAMAGPSVLPPGGAVLAPCGARQCRAVCAMRVGRTRQTAPLYGMWAARRRAALAPSQGAAAVGAGAEPCPVTPSWRQRWTWRSGAASARPSGSCSGRSWSGTRRRWHPSASARSAAATGRTTRRTGRGESGVGPESHSPPASAPGDGGFDAWPRCGLDRFGWARGWEQPGAERLGTWGGPIA